MCADFLWKKAPQLPPSSTSPPILETPIPNSQPQRHQPDLTSSPIPPPSQNPPTPGKGNECLVENCKMPQHGEGVSPVHIQAPSHSSHLSPSPRASIPPSPLSTNTYLPNVPFASLLPVLDIFTSVARTLTTNTHHTHHRTNHQDTPNTPCHVIPIPFQFRYLSNNPMSA